MQRGFLHGQLFGRLPLMFKCSVFKYVKFVAVGLRGLMRGMATLPQGNQELLVDKVGRPPGELGVSKSMECDIFPSVL